MSNSNLLDAAGLKTEDEAIEASESKTNETQVSNRNERKPEEGENSMRNERKVQATGSSNCNRTSFPSRKRCEHKPEKGEHSTHKTQDLTQTELKPEEGGSSKRKEQKVQSAGSSKHNRTTCNAFCHKCKRASKGNVHSDANNTEPWGTFLPDDNEKQNLRSFSPRHWPYLPQEGDCTNGNHTCIFCRTKGHHPTVCPNAAWAITFRKPKTFIPKDVRRHVLKLRGSAITTDELASYVNTKFLKRMTKHYSNLKEPNALRGPQFSQHAFEKAEATWKIHHKITNPKLNSTTDTTEEKEAKDADSEPNETNVSNQTKLKPEKGGDSNRTDPKPEEGGKSKRNESHSTQSKRSKTNNLTIPVSDATPTNPDEDEEFKGNERSDNEVKESSSGSDA